MKDMKALLAGNRDWVRSVTESDPGFFSRLEHQQSPKYFWIGCSDSRVPANEITGTLPGEIFVHRNVGNVVVHTDLNCLSVLQYAVDILKVGHIIVCGHYGCGGVRAALERRSHGLIDNWLRHIQDVQEKYSLPLSRLSGRKLEDMLCELNAAEQVRNICRTTILERAWDSGRKVHVHGLVYSVKDGRLRDMGLTCSSRAHAASLDGRISGRFSSRRPGTRGRSGGR